MHLLTGVLTLSLVSSVVLGGSFHEQQNVDAQKSHHLAEHVDSTDTDNIAVTLNPNATEKECHEGTAQVAIVSSTGQKVSQVASMRTMLFVFMDGATSRDECKQMYLGRTAPLFEHASLFATTISIRV